MLQDIAIQTGTVIQWKVGLSVEGATLRIWVPLSASDQQRNTTVIDGAGTAADIQARVGQIEAQMEDTSIHREKLQGAKPSWLAVLR